MQNNVSRLIANLCATFAAACAACGPCEMTTGVLVCDGDTPATAGTEPPATTSGDRDTDGAEATGAYDGACSILPGFEWGPCIAGGCPHAIVPSACVAGDLGSSCVPHCSSGCAGHLDPDCYGAADGVCAAPDDTCHFPCDGWCPDPGMVCDPSIDGGACVWPAVSDLPQCEGVDVPGQPFAPCLADFTCDAPGTICATDSNGAVCIPVSSEECADDHHPGCAGPVGFGTGYGAQVDACTLACTVDADCAIAGMVCSPNFGLCLWPN